MNERFLKLLYVSLTLCSITLNAQNNCFTRVPGIDLQSMNIGTGQWIDFNADGKQDLFISGYDTDNTSKYVYMYQNNGNKTFSEVPVPMYAKLLGTAISWGDYNNDGFIDFYYSGAYNGKMQAKLYKNDGSGNFPEVNCPFIPLSGGKSQFVDINNDGKQDFFQIGFDSVPALTFAMSENKGNGIFEKKDVSFLKKLSGWPGNFAENNVLWADFDNDGLLDVVIAATTQQDFYFKFYKNLGDFKFREENIGLPKLNYVSMAAGDVNQDGKTDLVYIGSTESMLGGSYNYASINININYGNLKFNTANSFQTNIFVNNMELADFDNDGYPDILYYGTNNGYLKIFRNNKNNTFTATNQNIAQAYYGAALWGDMDNDNDLDLFFSGELVSGGQKISYLYENTIPVYNQKPLPPTEIKLKAQGNQLIAEWNAGSDDSTKTASLRYLVRAGSTLHPDSLISGIADYEMLQKSTTNRRYCLNNAPEGKYYISVQTIDNSWNRSDFSEKKEVRFKHTQKIFGDTITINYGDSVKLYPGAAYKTYSWNTGDTTAYIYAKTEGLYSVNLTDTNDYLRDESVYVKVLGVPVVIVPEKDWYITAGQQYADEGYGVATDSDRNVYVAGRLSKMLVLGTDTLWGSPYNNEESVLLMKLDRTGKLLWWKKGTDKYSSDTGAYGVMVDHDNNVIVYGSFSNDFAFADTTILATLNNSEKLFVAKLRPDGRRIWVKGLGNIERPDQGVNIKSLHGTVDNDNKVIITGLTTDYETRFDAIVFPTSYPARDVLFILKLDKTGKIEWAKGATNIDQNAPSAVTTDNSNNIYISGYSFGKSTFFYTEPSTSQLTINKYALLKLTPSGNIDWSISGNGGVYVTSDTKGNVYAVGNWTSTSKDINLDTSKPNSILKINTSGKIEWQKDCSASTPLFLKTDSAGHLYYMAQREYNSMNPFIIDKDTVHIGNRFLCKMDSASNVIYLKTTGADGYYHDMAIDNKENVILTGRYFRAVFSDSIYTSIAWVDTVKHIIYYNYSLIGNQVSTIDGHFDIFVSKFCNELPINVKDTNLTRVSSGMLSTYPNPASDYLNIDLSALGTEQAVSFEINYLNGLREKKVSLQNQTSKIIQVDCRDWPSGMYIILVQTKGNVYTGKLIVKRR